MKKVQVGSTAPDALVLGPDGAVHLADTWRDGPVVLAFLRHFGSPFCKDFVAQLRDEHSRIVAAGADVVCVVMGSPAQAAEFRRERRLDLSCYADPDRSAYAAFGVGVGRPTQWAVSRRMAAPFARLLRRGVGIGLPHQGQDIRQMPATFVVARGGTIRLAHYSAHAADNPPMQDVLGALGIG